VKETAKTKWREDKGYQYINNVLDIKPKTPTVVIGTLFKDMPQKPCILSNLLGVLGTRKF